MGDPWDTSYAPPKNLQPLLNLIKFGSLWAWKNLWGYGRKVHAQFWPWGTPWDPSYDPPKHLQTLLNLIKIGSIWAWKNLWGYGRKVHAKFWPWGTPGSRVMTSQKTFKN